MDHKGLRELSNAEISRRVHAWMVTSKYPESRAQLDPAPAEVSLLDVLGELRASPERLLQDRCGVLFHTLHAQFLPLASSEHEPAVSLLLDLVEASRSRAHLREVLWLFGDIDFERGVGVVVDLWRSSEQTTRFVALTAISMWAHHGALTHPVLHAVLTEAATLNDPVLREHSVRILNSTPEEWDCR